MTDFLFVGLGNPGARYEATRHNCGFILIDEFVADAPAGLPAQWSVNKRAKALTATVAVEGDRVICAKPMTFMNLSGQSVQYLAHFFRIPPERIVVIHDELDLEFGTLRLKQGGGENGHNGLKSISQLLGTRDYIRLRCGIGRPPGRMNPADYVLGTVSADEATQLGVLAGDAAEALRLVATRGLVFAQNWLHSR
ncbi:MAG: aminoacyl-tRNA hydrolase [Corynebacterium sp.]|nr:aminoacyl-tRNA hydrolase [Corynebacterium sp.]